MKVVLAALPAFGHVYPLVPLALALERAGAEVAFATGKAFASRLPARTISGSDPSWVFSDATSELDRRMRELAGAAPAQDPGQTLFVELCAPHTADVLTSTLDHERPDLVVFEQSNVGAAMAAHRLGLRSVCLGIVGWGHRWSTIYSAVGEMLAVPAAVLAELFIDPHPTFLADPGASPPFPTLAMRPVAWSPSEAVPAWLLAPPRAPRVYLTMGTVFGDADVLRLAAQAIAGAGCEVLVATGPGIEAGDLGAMPASVHCAQEVPQVQVLPHVDVVVHHGGTGTVIGSIANGLPQLLMPQGADQFWNADHLSAEGACRVVSPEGIPGEIAAAVTALSADNAPERAAARRLQGVIDAMPDPDFLARRLLQTTGG